MLYLDAFIKEHVWYKALLKGYSGYSLRLELTCVCSLNGFQLYKDLPLFFLECVYISLLISPLFAFDI